MTPPQNRRLSEFCEINPRSNSDTTSDTTVSFLSMSDVSEHGTTTRGADRNIAEVKSGFTPFNNGDILVAKITPCFQNGKIAEASVSRNFGFGSTEFHVIRPNPDECDRRYLLHFLRQPWIRFTGELRMTGSGGQRRVPRQFIEELAVPLPSLATQRRIAAILDQSLVIRSTQTRRLGALNALVRSLYQKVVNSSDYTESTLGEIADITSGITKGRRTSLPTQPLPYLAVANVQEGRLDLDNVKEIEATKSETEKYRLKPGDLVLTEGGDPDKLGRGTVWRNELPICLHQNHIFRVRLHDNANNLPDFVSAAISSDSSKRYFLRSAKQTTGIASINMTQLRNLRIPLPAADVQQRFVADIERISLLRESYKKSLIEADALFSTLQSRAFRGEL